VPTLLDHAQALAAARPAHEGEAGAMALTGIDPSTLLLMRVSRDLMAAQDVIQRQRKQLAAMAAVLRTQQVSMTAMVDLVDALLSEPGDG
jgi:hypothetical protein